jgi:hypothetical protein
VGRRDPPAALERRERILVFPTVLERRERIGCSSS